MDGDITLTADLSITTELFISNDAATHAPYTLTIPSGVTVTLGKNTQLVLFGKIVNNGTFTNGSDSSGILMGSYAVFENNGIFNNRNHLGIFEGELSNSGVLSIGEAIYAHNSSWAGFLRNLPGGNGQQRRGALLLELCG
jgi:hypothetical protein